MRKIVVLLVSVITISCSANFFKNDDSIPAGFQRIDFSPKQNPRELIRDPLEQSYESLNSAKKIFKNSNLKLPDNIDEYLKFNNYLRQSYDEKTIANTIASIVPYISNEEINKIIKSSEANSPIFTATPKNYGELKIPIESQNILYKYTEKIKHENFLDIITFFDENKEKISKDKITASFRIINHYARNLNESLSFLNFDKKGKHSWELFIQCARGEISIKDQGNYAIPPWPRIIILQLNPNTRSTNKFTLHKNTLLKLNNTIKPMSNIYQNTTRSYIPSEILLPPNSILKNHIISKPNPFDKEKSANFIFFQEGMSKFFSQFMSSMIDNFKIDYNFSSWQILINKSWFNFFKKMNSNFEIEQDNSTITLNYLNSSNNIVDQNYSKDFLQNGIHFIDKNNINNYLLEIPDNLKINPELIEEEKITQFCANEFEMK